MKPLVAYYRVSTREQGRSGLGLEAQREAIARFAETEGFELVAEFTDIETGKGADALDRRPQLAAALETARRHGKSCPVAVAKLDRLSRDVHFISGLMTQRVPFVVAELGGRKERLLANRLLARDGLAQCARSIGYLLRIAASRSGATPRMWLLLGAEFRPRQHPFPGGIGFAVQASSPSARERPTVQPGGLRPAGFQFGLHDRQSRSRTISLAKRLIPSGTPSASSLGPSPSTNLTFCFIASGTTRMSENRVAASRPNGLIGCSVTYAASFGAYTRACHS